MPWQITNLKKFMSRLKYWLALVSLFPAAAFAQGGLKKPPAPAGLYGGFGPGTTATDLALFIINIVLAVVGVIAVAFLIMGGFRYITSAGNEEVAEGAKKTITNAIIGLIVVILSYVIITVIINAVAFNNP